VFSVDNDHRLVAYPISVGSIVGSGIVILEGLTLDMEIVKDARGLRAGQKVVVVK
jgi:hypothetical protein